MAIHNFSYEFSFERNFDEIWSHRWMQDHWADCFIYSALYLIIVFGCKVYMQQRPKFDLRPFLTMWSGILAIFSIFGSIRTLPELIDSYRYQGLYYTLCVPSFLEGPPAVWSFLFVLSKVFELGDTLFIVLRKQNLIFLHWYHHITVLMYVWYSYSERTAAGLWYMVMNYMVHSLMYSYYALRAMQIAIPKVVNMVITTLQLTQMIIGTAVVILTYDAKNSGIPCKATYTNIQWGLAMYVSYAALFAHFFYKNYIIATPVHTFTEKKKRT